MKWIIKLLMSMARLSMAEQGGGAGVEPAAAREFVSKFVPDPAVLKDMPDDKVMAYHGQVNAVLGEHVKQAREAHDWRAEIAGDNADALTTLKRFASPKAIYDSYDQFRVKLSKGELKAVAPFPDKGTDQEKTEWRAQNGIPAEAGKYEIKTPDGIVIGEADKPAIESLTKHAFEHNVPSAAVNEMVNWYLQERTEREETMRAAFDAKKTETAATLGQEWGPEYKPNMNKIQGLLDATIPADQTELKSQIKNAIDTNPHFARHYAAIALQINPAGTLGPQGMGANEGNVVDEIKKIEGQMRSNRAAYDKDAAVQKRYQDLLGAYGQITGKQWGQT